MTRSYTAETLDALETSHAKLLRAAKDAIGAGEPACGELKYLISAKAFDALIQAVYDARKVSP
jgi:hypothetical protein